MLHNIKAFMKKTKEQKGLTLVELLAVIVILGIIAGIAVPSVGGIIENSKADAHTANVEMIKAAAKLAAVTGVADTDNDGYSVSELVTEGLLEAAPKSPWKESVTYSGSVLNGDYTAGKEGSDGKG